MPIETADPACVWLVAPDEGAWEVLRVAAETLENFGLSWRRLSDYTGAGGARTTGPVAAVIVASPDELLPAAWSAATGLLTIRVPVSRLGRGGLTLLRDDRTGRLPAGDEAGVFATMAIGPAGAKNAALFVVAALATTDDQLRAKLVAFRQQQTDAVLAEPPPSLPG